MAKGEAVETVEYLKMVARMIKAGGRRVAAGDEYELQAFAALQALLESEIKGAIHGQLAQGKSWSGIAKGLGVTRQGAFRRWAK